MLSSAVPHATDQGPGPKNVSIPMPTAGQRSAAEDLHAAIGARQPMILVFGESGSGKTALINSVLDATDAAEFVVVNLSATSGEFLGPPSFDSFLEAICRRLGAPRPAKERPETLALLADRVSALTNKGQNVVLGVDHADHLSDDVIAELARLEEYLDRAQSDIIRIFVGSLTLASRIDSALRRLGIDQRLSEIRLSPPSAEEVAALLAYEDGCQRGGPMLTPDAIERISAYARSNLHWAVPMADAARILAESEGKEEVTAELVRSALHEIWSPEERPDCESPSHIQKRYEHMADPATAHALAPLGLSDSLTLYTGLEAPPSSSTRRSAQPRAVWGLALVLLAISTAIGLNAFSLRDKIVSFWPQQPQIGFQASLGPESLPEYVLRELTQGANMQQEPQDEITSIEPTAVNPNDGSPSVTEAPAPTDGRPADIKDVAKKPVPVSGSPKRRPDDLKTKHWIQTR